MLNDIKNRHTQDTAEKGIISLSQVHKDRDWLLRYIAVQSPAITESVNLLEQKDEQIQELRKIINTLASGGTLS